MSDKPSIDIEAERKDFERDAIAHGMSARRLSTDEYVSPSTAFRLSGWLARARIAAEREREMQAELARLRTLEAALPKTADGVAIVPGMTIYDRWLPEGWLVTGFDTTDGRLTCLYTKQGFDAICSGYYSTREAAEAAREAAEKARGV